MNATTDLGGEVASKSSASPARETIGRLVFGSALLIAVVSSRDYPGSWNDGSRLATVESIVDRHTLSIDDSTFVLDQSTLTRRGLPSPYVAPALIATGTKDRLLVDGRSYSDKPQVPAVLMAGVYLILRAGFGLNAASNPRLFCYLMTLSSAGLSYAIAVWSVFAISRLVGNALAAAIALSTSFALGTVALTYSRNVNSHVMLLAVAGLIFLNLETLARRASRASWREILIGSLAGLGYAIDPGVGMVLAFFVWLTVAVLDPRITSLMLALVAASPWIIAHHALNYSIGHTIAPANTVVAYLSWPGSGFDSSNITGTLPDRSFLRTVEYAVALLLGRRGFVGHNLPLFFAIPAASVLLANRSPAPKREVWVLNCGACFCLATWLMYALLSTNYSGQSCSIRWFVPMLAPSYLVIARFLRERPKYWKEFLVMSSWGTLIALMMWWQGPWMQHLVPGYWLVQAAAVGTVAVQMIRRRQGSISVRI